MNIEEMFELIDKNELVLPDFQRNFVWNKSGQRALAASILLNFPIGSFLILEGKKDDFATKKLGFSTQEANPSDECKFLLDGQQRLTSLRSIFGDFFNDENWKNTIRGIYNSLKTKWFLRIVPEEGEEDIFGWSKLTFDKEKLRFIEPSQLEDMIVDKPIGITKTNCWWNPEYIATGKNGDKIDKNAGKKYLVNISREMASENIIPLSIYNEDDRMLLDYALDYISKERSIELIAEINNDFKKAEDILFNADVICSDEVSGDNIDILFDELRQKWKLNISTYLKQILSSTEAQIISLKADEIGRAVIIFERINKGGTNLDNFDLVVARAARDSSEGSLTKRIIEYLKSDLQINEAMLDRVIGDKPAKINLETMETVKNNEITSVIKNQYLNLLSILSYIQYGNVHEIKIDYTKKEKILNISYKQINDLTNNVLQGLSRALAFLHIRCGIIKINELHYKLMILPIAYVLMKDEVWNSKKSLNKIEYWYWGSIFAGEYRMYPNQVSIDDIRDLYNWIVLGQQIKRYDDFQAKIFNIKEFSDQDTLIGTESETPVAIHKGILQYELSMQPYDLLYNEVNLNTWEIARETEITINNKKIKIEVQDHHIIPLATSKTLQESTKIIREDSNHILNSILNRTYILSDTNRIFSGNEPKKYLFELEKNNNIHMLNDHFIPDQYKEYLNSSAIENEDCIIQFYKLRFEKLKTLVYSEMNLLKN
ncbi:GmrSD restriction endonuclease domain-containing protein [Clostridium butyricum]